MCKIDIDRQGVLYFKIVDMFKDSRVYFRRMCYFSMDCTVCLSRMCGWVHSVDAEVVSPGPDLLTSLKMTYQITQRTRNLSLSVIWFICFILAHSPHDFGFCFSFEFVSLMARGVIFYSLCNMKHR